MVNYISWLRNSTRSTSVCSKAPGFQACNHRFPLEAWGAAVPNQLQSSSCSGRLGLHGPKPGSSTQGRSGCHVRASSFPRFLVVNLCLLLLGEAVPPDEGTFCMQLCQALAELCSTRAAPSFPQLGDAAQWQKRGCVPLPFDSARAVSSLVFYSV